MRGNEHEKAKRHVPPNAITVTKIEAAFRQLKTAILLYFSNGDEVAIHTLAYAAHEILHQLAKAKGIKGGFDGKSIEKLGKGIPAQEAQAFLSLSAGFFKHAGRDANDILHFPPEVNEHFLNEAVSLHVELTGEDHEEFECLRFAVMLRNPHLVNKDAMPPEEYAKWVRRAKDIKERGITPRDMFPTVRKLAIEYLAAKKGVARQPKRRLVSAKKVWAERQLCPTKSNCGRAALPRRPNYFTPSRKLPRSSPQTPSTFLPSLSSAPLPRRCLVRRRICGRLR